MCHVAIRLLVMTQNICQKIRKSGGEHRCRCFLLLTRADDIKNTKKVTRRAKRILGWCFDVHSVVALKAMRDQFLLILIGKAQMHLIFKRRSPKKRLGKTLDPNAEMLMRGIAVIKASMQFIRTGQDHIATLHAVNIVLHTEGNVAVQINVYFVIIVQMNIVVIGIIHLCKHLCIQNLQLQILKISNKRRKRRFEFHKHPIDDTKIIFFATFVTQLKILI